MIEFVFEGLFEFLYYPLGRLLFGKDFTFEKTKSIPIRQHIPVVIICLLLGGAIGFGLIWLLYIFLNAVTSK